MAHPQTSDVNLQVRCYAGYSYPERPVAFVWQGRPYEIEQILHRRRDPGGLHFRVRTREGEQFELSYQPVQDRWSLKRYRTP